MLLGLVMSNSFLLTEGVLIPMGVSVDFQEIMVPAKIGGLALGVFNETLAKSRNCIDSAGYYLMNQGLCIFGDDDDDSYRFNYFNTPTRFNGSEYMSRTFNGKKIAIYLQQSEPPKIFNKECFSQILHSCFSGVWPVPSSSSWPFPSPSFSPSFSPSCLPPSGGAFHDFFIVSCYSLAYLVGGCICLSLVFDLNTRAVRPAVQNFVLDPLYRTFTLLGDFVRGLNMPAHDGPEAAPLLEQQVEQPWWLR